MSHDDLGNLRSAVVKLFTTANVPNYYQPWNSGTQEHSGGTGCILDGRRILTNAHVVAHNAYIEVLKVGDTRKFPANIMYVDHDRELALLTIEDPEFWIGATPATLGRLPSYHSELAAFGYPVGGNELSISSGSVSRIEVRTYQHSQRFLLAIQTDAALNPGNSGGPVFAEGRLVGIVFQGYKHGDAASITYMVPTPIIEAFLQDINDDAISGVPDLGIFWQKMENATLKRFAKIPRDKSGVLVSRVVYGSTAFGQLCSNDVITALAGIPVADDGSVTLESGQRVHFTHVVSTRQVGDTLSVDILRNGEPRRVEVELRPFVALVSPPQPARAPRYVIFAGLVFVPLTYEYMASWGFDNAHFRYKFYYFDRLPSEHQHEVVILSQVLPHQATSGYHHMYGVVVESVNGQAIRDISDLSRAFRSPVGGMHVIEIDNHGRRVESSSYHSGYGRIIAIDADAAAIAHAEVLRTNRIQKSCSDDLDG